MRRFVTLAILAAAAYYGYTELLPKYRSHQQSQAAEEQAGQDTQQALHCVTVAESANSDFARGMRQFTQPPVDTGLWSTFMIQTGGQLSSADSACRCPHEACLTATAALLEQRSLLNQFDNMIRGTSAGISNPATSLERIHNLLARARSEAR
jgi:hypothetical protein